MNSIRLAAALIALILLSISYAIAQGQVDTAHDDQASTAKDSSFYTTDPPSGAGSLIQAGPEQVFSPESLTKNGLWIVDPNGWNRRTSLTIPLDYWARLEVVPVENGSIDVYESYPSGKIDAYNIGDVKEGYRYILWFYSDTTGTHEMWYAVAGRESDHVWFNVFKDSPTGETTYRYQSIS